MTARPMCPLCKSQGKTWALCRVCTDKLRENLRELPDLMRDLQDKRIGRTVMPAPANMVGNPLESPVPFSDHGRRTVDAIVNTVGTWIRSLAHDDPDDLADPGPTMPYWCRWLTERINRIRFHEAAADIAADIDDCCDRARTAVDLPPELVLVQKCETCGHGVFAGKDDKTAVCLHCKRAGVQPLPEIDVAKARARLDGMLEHQWATRAQCALVLAAYGMPVKEDTISAWARPERGRLSVRGYDSAGRPLYRVGDVADLVRGAIEAATRRATSDDPKQLDAVST